MAKGKFLGFVGKIGSLVGNVIPGAGVAGKLATNASNLMKDKSAQAAIKKERDKQVDKETKLLGNVLGGGTVGGAKFQVFMADTWEFVKKNWYLVLPAVLALLWVLFFSKKKRVVRRRSISRRSVSRRTVSRKYTPVRRKRTAQPKGSAWARKMLLARRKKARSRKK